MLWQLEVEHVFIKDVQILEFMFSLKMYKF